MSSHKIADVFVFVGKNTRIFFEKSNFDAKFGEIGGDFAAGGAGADNRDDFWQTTDFDG